MLINAVYERDKMLPAVKQVIGHNGYQLSGILTLRISPTVLTWSILSSRIEVNKLSSYKRARIKYILLSVEAAES